MYVEPLPGLFHYQIAVLNLIYRAHHKAGIGFGTWSFWISNLNRPPHIWNEKYKKIHVFRDCDHLLNTLLDGHVLALLALETQETDVGNIGNRLQTRNWRKVIRNISNSVLDFETVDRLRECEAPERDIVYENAVLFVQQALVYRRFSEALEQGDSGWAERCIALFTIWFQNDSPSASSPVYRKESLHLMVCLKHRWSDELKFFYRNNLMVSLSGKKGSFMAVDQASEYVVREAKAVVPKSDTPASDKFFRKVLGRQSFTFKNVRDHMQQESDARKHYMHSSTVDASRDVFSVARHLLRRDVFVKQPGRSRDEAIPSVDLLSSGLGVIGLGGVVKAYNESIDSSEFSLAQLEDVPLDTLSEEIEIVEL